MKYIAAVVALCLVGASLANAQPAPAQGEPPRDAGPNRPSGPPAVDPKPFADLVKDATTISGLFPVYRTEDKVFMEIAPSQMGTPFMLSLTCDHSLGERGFYAAEMCGEAPFTIRKVNKNIQFVLENQSFQAEGGTPMARAVAQSFADSVLGMAPVASLPHPDRKSVLIDLGTVLLADVPMLAWALEATFRIPYRFDTRNSYFAEIRGFEKNVEIATVAHYTAERPPVPPLLPPGAPQPPQVAPPRTLVDARSMLVRLRYSISTLPDDGYVPRLADARVGHFFSQVQDYSEKFDSRYTPARRFINRWRLEKSDPNAALSPPKQPIVFWLENTIPMAYRPAIRDGALMWNKAFERIGFKDAIVVKQQPDDADWDPADTRYNTIRWFAGIDAGFAQGPSRANPRTGELYDADIRFSEAIVRSRRDAALVEQTPLTFIEPQAAVAFRAPWSTGGRAYCTLGRDAALEMGFSMDVLEARGMDADSPEATRIVLDFLREISAHEVGHTLGLRHNFRASTIRTIDAAQDAAVTSADGLTGSVMDYIPANLAKKGAKQAEYHQSTLGPYDYWAIEYAYRPLAGGTPDAELAELKKIASKAADPRLAYGTDEDAGGGPEPFNMDPSANRFDMGTDPLAFYRYRLELSREVLDGMEAKLERPGEGYQVLRRSFMRALGQAGQAFVGTSKYIGGVYHARDYVADPNGRAPYRPVPASEQKQALAILTQQCFAPGAFKFAPQLLNKLDRERLWNALDIEASFSTPQDLPVHDLVLNMQRAVLDRVFHPMVLKRVSDNELRYVSAQDRFSMGDLFGSLQQAIWSDALAPSAVSIDSHRRNLQREHLKRMIGMVLRDASAPEDARTMARYQLAQLRRGLQGSAARAANLETRAHLQETVARLDEALSASLQRTAF